MSPRALSCFARSISPATSREFLRKIAARQPSEGAEQDAPEQEPGIPDDEVPERRLNALLGRRGLRCRCANEDLHPLPGDNAEHRKRLDEGAVERLQDQDR